MINNVWNSGDLQVWHYALGGSYGFDKNSKLLLIMKDLRNLVILPIISHLVNDCHMASKDVANACKGFMHRENLPLDSLITPFI